MKNSKDCHLNVREKDTFVFDIDVDFIDVHSQISDLNVLNSYKLNYMQSNTKLIPANSKGGIYVERDRNSVRTQNHNNNNIQSLIEKKKKYINYIL